MANASSRYVAAQAHTIAAAGTQAVTLEGTPRRVTVSIDGTAASVHVRGRTAQMVARAIAMPAAPLASVSGNVIWTCEAELVELEVENDSTTDAVEVHIMAEY